MSLKWKTHKHMLQEKKREKMDPDNRKDVSRRKFVKNAGCAALCCQFLPLGVYADSARTSENKEHLAAVCGTYCGACPAYIAKHSSEEQINMRRQKRFSSGPGKALKTIPDPGWMDGILCDGCLSDGEIAAHCQRCAMKTCAANKKNVTQCSDCSELPCPRITNFINTGLLHRAEYLPNLEKIHEMGVREWVKYEEERWLCPRCGLPMSWYDAECTGCGDPRSGRLFPLS